MATKKTTKKPAAKKAVAVKKMPVMKASSAKMSGPTSCCFTNGCLSFYGCYAHGIKRYVKPFFALFVRLWIARIFWYSGLAKITDWNATLDLFKNEYKVPDISPIFAAYSSAGFELVCSALLAIGFMSRLAVLPLIAMSLVIHSTYDASIEPLYWAILLGMIFSYGPGCISVDAVIKHKCWGKDGACKM